LQPGYYLVKSDQSKEMMPLKFVHLFVEMSQTIFKKPHKQMEISAIKIKPFKTR